MSWWLARYDDLPLIAGRQVGPLATIAHTVAATIPMRKGAKRPKWDDFVPQWANTRPSLPPVLEDDLKLGAKLGLMPQEHYDYVRSLIE